MSFDVILPFLRPIEHLILDDDDVRNHGQREPARCSSSAAACWRRPGRL